ncbi:MAG: hypothetical protein QXU21_07740 [Candidatus Bathyarchaeia archaeon]
MQGTKYGKYFIKYDPSRWPDERRSGMVVRLEDSIVKGSNFYVVHWYFPDRLPKAAHPPHIHKHAELLMLIGTDPDKPMDLGAEVELHMGPELEKHVITETTAVYIPPNFIHGPWKIVKTFRPWLIIQILQGPAHTEKLCPEVLPKEMKDEVDWAFWRQIEEGFDE